MSPAGKIGSALLLAIASLSCGLVESNTRQDASPPSDSELDESVRLRWPIETGVSSFVTQSPTTSKQPYPCGSGVNAQHILHDEHGDNTDYTESFDVVIRDVGDAADKDGRGTDVVAVADGRVVAVNHQQDECERPFGAGNYVIIEHPQIIVDGKALRSAYMHLNSTLSVEVQGECILNPSPTVDFTAPALGAYVQGGQKIGELGNTGNSTGPHLHFQFATQCTLEPADAVDCPAISPLAINRTGFYAIEVEHDESCGQPNLGVGGPAPSDSYLADGSYVTSRADQKIALSQP